MTFFLVVGALGCKPGGNSPDGGGSTPDGGGFDAGLHGTLTCALGDA